ncbi:MAG: hypothetical protein E3K40_13260 [Candidatus Brocadia sp.]|nr:hypothetical protein [Candidatus Brocadia sp.]MDG6027648.1 hypothetical protein [Candidatus Brocadia sp.]
MKTRVKIAIIGAIATVAAAVIPVVMNKNDKNGNSGKPIVTPSPEYHQTGNISIEESKNVVIGNITTHEGDVIIEGTKTTSTQALPESQNSETKKENEH